ncbi:MAG: asparagine synthase-related protein [Candidatus Bathyarchaeia archaeon]|jgi:asparagine synthase (glutamine-hydrolysing)
MPGLWGIITENNTKMNEDFSDAFHEERSVKYLRDNANVDGTNFGRFSVDKFKKDKIFRKVGQTSVVSEGIVLNMTTLLRQYHARDFAELVTKVYEQFGLRFINLLRGNFAVFLCFHSDNKALLFTDHLAAKPVYYYWDKRSRTLVFASELKVVSRIMRHMGFACHLDVNGAYCLLTFGYMLGDLTLIREVSKIPPGHALVYDNGEIEVEEYYRFSNKPYVEDAEAQIVRELDQRFREAIRLEYNKDSENGYSHLVTLSGGLDSRTNVAYAEKIGYDNITCFTFSESNYLDQKIARQICSDHHFRWVFYALDNGDYLATNLDEIVASNDGMVLYGGSAHLYSCLRNLSFEDYGLVHTGMLGDAMYKFLEAPYHTHITDDLGAYSNRLLARIQSKVKEELAKYPTIELFKYYNRGINCVFNGYRMIEQFTEFSSPFLYKDFLDYVLRIHPKYRYKASIYLKWINSYLPEYSGYIWEHCGVPPKYPRPIRTVSWSIRAAAGRIFREQPRNVARTLSMNPFDCWWRHNDSLRKRIQSIFEQRILNIDMDQNLREDSEFLFRTGSLLEKTQVLTLITAIKTLGLTNDV